jgi:hypothetical protein
LNCWIAVWVLVWSATYGRVLVTAGSLEAVGRGPTWCVAARVGCVAAAAAAAAVVAGSPVGAGSMSAKPPRVLVLPELRNLDVGLWEGQSTKLVGGVSCRE